MSVQVKRPKKSPVLALTNKNEQHSRRDSSGRPKMKERNRSAFSNDDEENVRPEIRVPMNGYRDSATVEGATSDVLRRRKRDGSWSSLFEHVNLPTTRLRSAIDSGGDDVVSVKRPRKRPSILTYSEDEDESGSNIDSDGTDELSLKKSRRQLPPLKYSEDEDDSASDTENSEDAKSKSDNWSECDTDYWSSDGDTTDDDKETQIRKSKSGKRGRQKTGNKKGEPTVLVEKSMISHGKQTAHIWVPYGKKIRKYIREQHENPDGDQRLIYKQTDKTKRYSRKNEAHYQAIPYREPCDNHINHPPEVIEVTSWNVFGEHQIGFEDFKTCLEILIKTLFDEDFLANVRNNKNENEKFMEALNKMISLLDMVKEKVRSNAWKPDCTAIMETYPVKTCVGTVNTKLCQKVCEICKRKKSIAKDIIEFKGPNYDSLTLRELSSGEEENRTKFKIGRECFERTDIYHNLHHYLYYLLKACEKKVEGRLGDNADDVVFEIFTSEDRWVKEEHHDFNKFLKRSAERFDRYERRRRKKYKVGQCYTV
ncbi:coiled-coil domain-containing protein 82-like [Ptychodera flava]|uniref:coiled-coil domain-containing protein 82-like n=1 Tax=Ptychodera flava TaxID=63121 RepID=UPI00396A2035